MKYLQRYLSLLFVLVLCVGVFSVTAHAEEITDLTLSLNHRIWRDSDDVEYANYTNSLANASRYLVEVPSNSTTLGYDVYVSTKIVAGRDNGTILAKAGDKFQFRIQNIVTNLYLEKEGNGNWYKWNNADIVAREVALIHTDGTWTYLQRGIDWVYTSGNDSHSISVDIETPKDVRKIQYFEYINTYALTGFFGYSDHFLLSGDSINPLTVTIDVQSEEVGLLGGILDKVTSGFSALGDKLTSGFTALGDKLTNVFNSIVELPQKLWNLISDGLKGLFVPSEESMTAYKDKWDDLLASRFGAVYQVVNIMTDSWDGIMQADETDTIEFPQASINLAGSSFTFGGYDVKIVPDGFGVLVAAIKSIVAIVCTVAFVNGMRKRYDEIMGVEQ